MANISIKKDFEDGQKLFAQQLNNNFETIELGINAGNKLIWKDDNGAEFQTFRGTTEEIENRPIIDGQELYNIENGATFLDVGETRKVMNKPLWKDDNGAQVQSFRGTTAEVAARPIIDGQTLYNIETGETALDVGDKRISTGAGNVVYIGDEEPQNDATKIWIENDQVLNLGSEVAISSEEPTTQEKVWIQRGKNLINPSELIHGCELGENGTLLANINWVVTPYIAVTENQKYYVYGFKNASQIDVYHKCYYDENYEYIGDDSLSLFTTPKNTRYVRLNGRKEYLSELILVQSEVAVDYEPYIPKKIHTKTDNGVYEEFYNEEEHNKVVLFEGTLLGGESIQLDGVKRYMDVYFCMASSDYVGALTGKYIIDTSINKNLVCGSIVMLCHDDDSGLAYYVSESNYDKSNKTFTHKRTGFFNISTGVYSGRNTGAYRVYRIETYD